MEKGFLAVTYRNCSLVKFPIPGGIAPLIEVWSNILQNHSTSDMQFQRPDTLSNQRMFTYMYMPWEP
jgi:hypothetical protein